jgi:hypothetical protein
LKAGIVESEDIAIARDWLYKYLSTATNSHNCSSNYTNTAIEELLKAMFVYDVCADILQGDSPNAIRAIRQYNMVMGLVELGTKYHCVCEGQQQFSSQAVIRSCENCGSSATNTTHKYN